MLVKLKFLFVLFIQLVTVALGSVLKLNPAKDPVDTTKSNEQIDESANPNGELDDGMKTSETFHRHYYHQSRPSYYYHQPATGYYNRYPQTAQRPHQHYYKPAPVYWNDGYDSDTYSACTIL